jgi:hypothetical protein
MDAEDVALTLSWAAPPGVRIAPVYRTNSIVISGPEAAVEQMVDVIRRRRTGPRGPGKRTSGTVQ